VLGLEAAVSNATTEPAVKVRFLRDYAHGLGRGFETSPAQPEDQRHAEVLARLDAIDERLAKIDEAVTVIRTAQSWNLPTLCEEHEPRLARAIKEGRR
jgi:hypothetical protein